MNKWNRRNILYVPEEEPGPKNKSWSHSTTRFVSRWPGVSHAFLFLLSSWKVTIVTTHAYLAQVQNTQTLNGRQEVEYFCQISFRLKLLQLFSSPHCWSWLFLLSIMEPLVLTFLSSDSGWTTAATLPACRTDVGRVWPCQIPDVPPTLLTLYF